MTDERDFGVVEERFYTEGPKEGLWPKPSSDFSKYDTDTFLPYFQFLFSIESLY